MCWMCCTRRLVHTLKPVVGITNRGGHAGVGVIGGSRGEGWVSVRRRDYGRWQRRCTRRDQGTHPLHSLSDSYPNVTWIPPNHLESLKSILGTNHLVWSSQSEDDQPFRL